MAAGVVYVAAERTGMAEVTCRSTPQVTRFLFGKVPESSTCQAAALLGVVDSLTRVGVTASTVRSPHPKPVLELLSNGTCMHREPLLPASAMSKAIYWRSRAMFSSNEQENYVTVLPCMCILVTDCGVAGV